MSNPNPIKPELYSINTLAYVNHSLKKNVKDVCSRILVYVSLSLLMWGFICFFFKCFVFAQYSVEIGRPVVLTKRSRPAEVKMWLENKAFNKMWVGF